MPATTTISAHWHAYAYTGKAVPDSRIRSGLAPAGYPPIEIKDWLHRPPLQIFAETEVDEAMAWLEKELSGHMPVDADAFPVAVRLEYSRARLQESVNRDVVYGYYSARGQYVSRSLILCEAPDCR